MESPNKILQSIGIPYTALLSVVFGLLLVSLPMGIFVVFQSDIGGDIHYDFPITHLELFSGTEMYQAPTDVSIGDVFVMLWLFYVVIFVIATLGPENDFLKSLSPIISLGNLNSKSNYMIGVTKWFSILILISAIVTFVQDKFHIQTIPPMMDNDLIHFFYVSLSPLLEEFGFRFLLIGIPLFLLYSHRSSLKYFLRCLWSPKNLEISDPKKALVLVVIIGVLFGFAHIAVGDSWSEGKFAQASASGIILGWVYLRYGFVGAILVHWATNYFVFSYANFLAQINSMSVHSAFSHSLMTSLEMLLLVAGTISLAILILNRFYSRKKSSYVVE